MALIGAQDGFDLVRLDAADASGVGLESVGDLAIGVGRQLGDQHLHVSVLALEAWKGLGLGETDQRHHADAQARREDRISREGREGGGDEKGERGEGAYQGHG